MKTLGLLLLAALVLAAIQAAMEAMVWALEPTEEERERCEVYAMWLRDGTMRRVK